MIIAQSTKCRIIYCTDFLFFKSLGHSTVVYSFCGGLNFSEGWYLVEFLQQKVYQIVRVVCSPSFMEFLADSFLLGSHDVEGEQEHAFVSSL